MQLVGLQTTASFQPPPPGSPAPALWRRSARARSRPSTHLVGQLRSGGGEVLGHGGVLLGRGVQAALQVAPRGAGVGAARLHVGQRGGALRKLAGQRGALDLCLLQLRLEGARLGLQARKGLGGLGHRRGQLRQQAVVALHAGCGGAGRVGGQGEWC